MSQTIKLKRGTTTPTTSNIVSGEVAIDTSAKKLYINDSGTIKEIGGIGTLSASDIPNLPASKITSGTFATARIPDLAASKITSGTFAASRIPSLAASKITSGTFDAARIPTLSQYIRSDANDTTTGRLTFSDGGYSIGNELHVWKRDYVVKNTSPKDLLYHDGNALPNGGAYRVQAHIAGTGTDQSATAVFWNQNGTWKVNVAYQSGTSSNHPEFIVGSNGKPQIHIDHTSNYTISILHERLELSESTGTDNKSGFGADGYMSEVSGVLRHNPNGGSNYTAGNRVFADNYHPNANKLTTARTIAGSSFDGTANINISYNNLTDKPTIPTVGNGTLTITAGTALTGGGSFTANQSGNSSVTINHGDTSSQASVNNSGNTVIQDITLDTHGHITGITSKALSIPAAPANATITINAGTNLTGGGNFTTNQSSNETITINHEDVSSQGSVNNSGGTVIQDVSLNANGHVTSLGSVNLDSRYYTESEMKTFFKRGYIENHTASNLAVGWYTIATQTGDRALGEFTIWDTASSDHQAVIFNASHHFGVDNSNDINVLANSRFSGTNFRYIRIKDGGTYEGAALQVYVDGATNSVAVAITGSNAQSSGWVLKDWIADATDPGDLTNYSSMGERVKVDLDDIINGGILTSGDLKVNGNVGVGIKPSASYRMYVAGTIAQSTGSIIAFGDVQTGYGGFKKGSTYYINSSGVLANVTANANIITSGTFADGRIPSLNASKITAGTFASARIPNLDASKITAGTLGTARIPNLSGAKITSGTVAAARIDNLAASKITSGTFDVARLPTIPYSQLSGTPSSLPANGGNANTVGGVGESSFMRKTANSGLNMVNNNITNVNLLTFNDPGVQEGIKWNGGNQWQIYESPDNQTNASGNLQFTSGSGNGVRRMTLNTDGGLFVGTSTTNGRVVVQKADNNAADHVQFYIGSTRMGEIGSQDTTWLRINQVTSKNIYTPRIFRSDGGFQTKQGSATAPSICYHSDTNTGIFFPGDDVLKFTTGGVNAVTVNNTDIQLIRDSVSVKDYLRHYGDTNTYFRFTTDRIRLVAGGVTFIDAVEGATDYLRFVHRGVTIGSNTNPQATLTVDQSCTETPANGCGTGRDAHIKLENTNTTGSASTCIIFNAKDSGGNMRHGAGIQFKKAIAWSANGQYPGELYFWTRPTSGNQAAAQKLDKDGNAIFKGNVTAYGSLSDRRLKENIEPIADAVAKVEQLEGVTFDYKKDGRRSTGLIAQDLEKVLPEAVYTTTEVEGTKEHMAIHYGNTVGLLVNAIKEQQQTINQLTKRIEELENGNH